MLEHVTANQTRFVAPGLSPDPRGIALGRYLTVLLGSLDRVVGLLRGLSERWSLDNTFPTLKIFQVRSPLKSRELVVQLPVTSSSTADGVAAVAALLGGLCFTGTAKHFVKYRDTRSPMGYDVDSLYAGQGELILYHSDFVQAYDREREISFASLAQNLSLQLERGDQLLSGEQALLRVEAGLWKVVLGYLDRHGCASEVAACERPSAGRAAVRRFYLVRCRLAPRMEQLFRHTPGIELYRQKGERIAVQLGYRHPLELAACQSVFAEGRYYLFSGARDVLEVLPQAPVFVSSEVVVRLVDPDRSLQVLPAALRENETLGVSLRLVAVPGARRQVHGRRIPLEQASWLKKLVYLLPPPALSQTGVCFTANHIFLYSPTAMDLLPIGEMFHQAAPGVLAPVGFELTPRLPAPALLQQLGAGPDAVVFFLPESPTPLRFERAAFAPLSQRTLGDIPLAAPATVSPQAPAPAAGAIVNDPLGLFPLWGYRSEPEER